VFDEAARLISGGRLCRDRRWSGLDCAGVSQPKAGFGNPFL